VAQDGQQASKRFEEEEVTKYYSIIELANLIGVTRQRIDQIIRKTGMEPAVMAGCHPGYSDEQVNQIKQSRVFPGRYCGKEMRRRRTAYCSKECYVKDGRDKFNQDVKLGRSIRRAARDNPDDLDVASRAVRDALRRAVSEEMDDRKI
jgi:hypothetical protein